ncbi:adenylate/guanylate cyclase domain-containing protein [Spirulina major CS-329]|uniref:adenylate/guanylate cyclase domain-containing protein n=1 Tax=Spirulina TaxID=1154 RepID=UPI00232F4356|nr:MULTISPECIES: adenylate/guanylate cyclase domain-containing protein [Spirulina]MDB9496709.1 adenylate/guanylate cyclase domain-containing protein [Spirulina subsalsa CS-330]MDB9503184.1 adenylate/guanylate cyclase domain-containing protein [Spirulina major CS-329]
MRRINSPKIHDHLTVKLEGTRFQAFIRELLTNSGHFLVLKGLAELIVDGWRVYLTHPPEYLLIFAVSIQAWYLSRPTAQRFWGNLIGVGVYTVLDVPLDGWGFFTDFSHLVFWGASLAIALSQYLRTQVWPQSDGLLIPLESVVRTLMIQAFYLVVQVEPEGQVTWDDLQMMVNSHSHRYFLGSVVLIGLFLGLRNLQVSRQQRQLRETARSLQQFAEWGIGAYAVNQAVNNPDAVALTLQNRTIIFMDIRGFTRWCEQHEPDAIAHVLNAYYYAVEPAAAAHDPIRVSFTGDEIMAIYATPAQGIAAAQAMRNQSHACLAPHGLGAGCAVHCGPVMEGFFGSQDLRTYTVIGDTVNTAKRLESATPAGQITLSDAVYHTAPDLAVQPLTPITVKGKQDPLTIWQLMAT